MSINGFTPVSVQDNLFADRIPASQRGNAYSVRDMYGPRAKFGITDAAVHDANFAFLTTTLAKLHQDIKEPKYFVTWNKDIPFDIGGGFVDYIEYYTVDWAGIMSEFRNVVGNNANYIPRVNAGMSQNRVNVYTFEVAYDLRFIELEKMQQLALKKSIQEIYQNAIIAQWDLFVQKVAYTGMGDSTGLFNDEHVKKSTISVPTAGFAALSDDAIVSAFNGIFETYLNESNMNVTLLPDTILVPSVVGKTLTSRFSALYSETLRSFIQRHNLGAYEFGDDFKLSINIRPALDELGTGNKGRIVAYKKDKSFVRIDIPYPMQHYVTLPNIDKMSYTTAFVGQVSAVQLPYNTDSESFGAVTYWDLVVDSNLN